MRQIRRGVFETNSSSTHSLTMMMKSDYERWESDGLYMFDGYEFEWESNGPIKGRLYTYDEVIAFAKTYKYLDVEDECDIDDVMIKEIGFISFDDEGSEYLEGFYEEFTTPSGETIVAFGEYGYDG
jgi:hypothetical protein